MLPYPHIDPVAIRIPLPSFITHAIAHVFGAAPSGLDIRWYSLAYIGGILLGWWIFAKDTEKHPIANLTKKALDDMVVWAVFGIILGGRLGYVLFYKPDYYFAHPLEIFRVWEGGMSFHGGMIGFIIAFWLFSRKYRVSFTAVIDVLACVAPIGLFLGRIANFINGELWGRVTDVPWGMVFPDAGPLPRHPSELYEAGMEGVLLFAVLMFLLKRTSARKKPLLLGGVFLTGYALSRITAECFREPDAFLGYFFGAVTMGQLLSLPMLALGLYLTLRPVKSLYKQRC